MKRLMLFFATLVMCGAMSAQGVLTLVIGDAYDGFVNIRQTPSSNGRVVDKLYNGGSGNAGGIKLGRKGNWTKVKVDNKVGWCYSKYVSEWNYVNNQRYVIIAAKPNTAIYSDYHYNDVGTLKLWTTVPKGTIIADFNNLSEHSNGGYYWFGAHVCYLVRKSDVIVKRRY
jgi:hypothetical protein